MLGRGRVGEALVATVKRFPLVHRTALRAKFALGRVVPPRTYDGLPGRVHFNDFMFDDASPAGIARYRERALNVMQAIERALDAAERSFDDVESWLDFGCGYGRVTRFLVQRVPPDRAFAADVVREGVDFCRSEFGVHPVYSEADICTIELGSFDFIFGVSVLSHLNERNSVCFLQRIGDSLEPGGIALFTIHGAWSIEHPEWYGEEFRERRAEIERAVADHGMCFLPYRHLGSDDYGLAWHSREYIETTIRVLHRGRLRLLRFEPAGLDGHQDVFAFQREPSTR